MGQLDTRWAQAIPPSPSIVSSRFLSSEFKRATQRTRALARAVAVGQGQASPDFAGAFAGVLERADREWE